MYLNYSGLSYYWKDLWGNIISNNTKSFALKKKKDVLKALLELYKGNIDELLPCIAFFMNDSSSDNFYSQLPLHIKNSLSLEQMERFISDECR